MPLRNTQPFYSTTVTGSSNSVYPGSEFHTIPNSNNTLNTHMAPLPQPAESRFDHNVAIDEHYEENPAVLLVNSADRNTTKYPEPNKYLINLRKPYKRITSIDLQRADIPASGYIINQYNNALHFVDNSVEYDITITPGDYDIDELTAAIETAMNAEPGPTGTYSVSSNTITNKITIARTGGSGTFELLFDGGEKKHGTQHRDEADFDNPTTVTYGDSHHEHRTSSIAKVIGFKATDYTGDTSYEGPYTYNLNPDQYIIIKIKDFDRIDSTNVHTDGAFLVIFLESANSAYRRKRSTDLDDESCNITFNPPMEKLERLEISVFDANGNPYDFNGHNHVLGFEINSMSRSGKFRYKSKSKPIGPKVKHRHRKS